MTRVDRAICASLEPLRWTCERRTSTGKLAMTSGTKFDRR